MLPLASSSIGSAISAFTKRSPGTRMQLDAGAACGQVLPLRLHSSLIGYRSPSARVREDMLHAATELRFEDAAKLRDRLKTLEELELAR